MEVRAAFLFDELPRDLRRDLLALSNSSLKEPNILPMRPRPLPTMRAASLLAWAAFFLAAAFWASVGFLTLGLAAASALGAASAVWAAAVWGAGT